DSHPIPVLIARVTPRRPTSTLFPYTTLFRSSRQRRRLRWLRSAWSGQRRRRRKARDRAELDHGNHPRRRRTRHPGPLCDRRPRRSEEHTSELQSHLNLVCRLLLEKKNKRKKQ